MIASSSTVTDPNPLLLIPKTVFCCSQSSATRSQNTTVRSKRSTTPEVVSTFDLDKTSHPREKQLSNKTKKWLHYKLISTRKATMVPSSSMPHHKILGGLPLNRTVVNVMTWELSTRSTPTIPECPISVAWSRFKKSRSRWHWQIRSYHRRQHMVWMFLVKTLTRSTYGQKKKSSKLRERANAAPEVIHHLDEDVEHHRHLPYDSVDWKRSTSSRTFFEEKNLPEMDSRW